MQVSLFETLPEIDRLESEWNALYQADEHAHVFTSWPWLRFWFTRSPDRPLVLAARPSDHEAWAAFFPLTSSSFTRRRWAGFHRLSLGGKPFADYTGFLCSPRYGLAPLAAFARHLQTAMQWDYLDLTDVVDPRLNHFVRHFPGKSYRLELRNCTASPRMRLPASWDEFLRANLSYKARFHLRKSLREMESLPDFRVSTADVSTWQAHADVLLDLWQKRHGTKPESTLQRYRDIFANAFEARQLWLKIAWQAEVPIAGLAAYIDPWKKGFYCFMTAFNPLHEKLAPGKALFGYAIREAIAEGFTVFDLLRGGDHYKTSRLGAIERMAVTMTLLHRRRTRDRLVVATSRPAHSRLRVPARVAAPAAPRPASTSFSEFLPGELVRVRRLEDIRASLGKDAYCQGCRFTESMAQFCGQDFPILKKVECYYDEAKGVMLACDGIYLLAGAHCDGSAFPAGGGCDRTCLLFWRREWLEQVDKPDPPEAARGHDSAGSIQPATATPSSASDPPSLPATPTDTLTCQLRAGGAGASEPTLWRIRRRGRSVRRAILRIGNRMYWRSHRIFFKVSKRLMRLLWPSFSRLQDRAKTEVPPSKKHEPDLSCASTLASYRAGNLVRVRSWTDILSCLDELNCTQGCYFMPSMKRYCGQEFRIVNAVERFYDEVKGKVRRCRNVYFLDGVHCDGTGNPHTTGCDRTCYIFWRTEWLEPVN